MKEIVDKKGRVINPGFSTKMDFNYDRKKIKVREGRMKEWDFFQFKKDDWVFQFVIGHALIFESCSYTIFNMTTKEKYEDFLMPLHIFKNKLYPNDQEENYIEKVSLKNFNLEFIHKDDKRYINFEGTSKNHGYTTINIEIDSPIENDKMVILTPFLESKKMFYLNYKENYYNAKIDFKNEKTELHFDNVPGLIDSGRGYWPFHNEWYWGNHSYVSNGHRIGWNLGFGFGDTSNATENIIFYDLKGYKLGKLNVEIDVNEPMKPITIDEENGLLHLEMDPIYDNYTSMKILFINKYCHQVYYKTNGYFLINDEKIKVDNEISFFEHEVNNW